MPEPIDAWWERRRASTGLATPYAVGTYREQWRRFPVLVRQYHPDLNRGITLSQVPLAADVWLLWQCDVGHQFIATPQEQRMRPGRERRASTWCPTCFDLATGRAVAAPGGGARAAGVAAPMRAGPIADGPEPPRSAPAPPIPPARRSATKRSRRLCEHTPTLPPGEPFASVCAPLPASAAEAELRAALAARIAFDATHTAVRLRQPFFEHLEAWPDIVLGDLRVAIEYDTTGRHGLEHVGRRERVDARKDQLLRNVGWEVVRIRTSSLAPLGPHDVEAAGVSNLLVTRILDELRAIRGPLFVDAYLRA